MGDQSNAGATFCLTRIFFELLLNKVKQEPGRTWFNGHLIEFLII